MGILAACKRSRSLLRFGIVAALLVGCTVGPNYTRPSTEVPEQYRELPETGEATAGATAPTAETAPLDITRWWTVFDDTMLSSLIDRAVRSNKDLRFAEARIREARARRGVVSADLYPAVSTFGDYARSRASANTTSPSANVSDRDLFQAGFDARWEIDVFGGTRRAVEAAEADIGATEENRRDVLVTLLSEVARNYLELRGTQLRIALADENIKVQESTVNLTQERLAAGIASELEVAQAQAQLASTRSRVPVLESAAKQSIHRLGVLLGQEPGALLAELSEDAPIPPAPPGVPVGLPSELLRRRPDVRRAERELAAATARIGVATADLFPKFSLTGDVGLQSIHAGDFLSAGSRLWSIGPGITWPVFDAGRIRANIRVENARQEQALVAYEQAVLIALEDVENGLVAYSKEQVSRRALVESVVSNQRAVEISGELYSKGMVSFLNVLVSQLALFQSQDALAQSDQTVSTNLVALFKALGGGWDVEPGAGYSVSRR
jgi:NodT family efflux transporter outer membrane factor (OMF) lipoprotein